MSRTCQLWCQDILISCHQYIFIKLLQSGHHALEVGNTWWPETSSSWNWKFNQSSCVSWGSTGINQLACCWWCSEMAKKDKLLGKDIIYEFQWIKSGTWSSSVKVCSPLTFWMTFNAYRLSQFLSSFVNVLFLIWWSGEVENSLG